MLPTICRRPGAARRILIPAQLLAYHLTRAKGLDPERPRNLQKVTLTH